jgi:hypothetical protein
MPVVRALLLAVVATLVIIAVSFVFVTDTGPLEKAVLVALAALIALSVPRIHRMGGTDPR